MRAVVLRAFGAPECLRVEDVPEAIPGPGEVVVAVEFASITFVETQVRAGRPPNPAMLPTLPVVPGNGVGGVVAAVGEGVDPSLGGRSVVSTTGGSGGYAERVVVDAGELIDVPPGLALEDAVALLADGRTAMGLTDVAALRPGDTVLVEAAAGGVGSLLVQLARHAGASVVAAAGGTRKVALASELGADVAVDYSDPAWASRVRDEVGELDVVFDGVGGAIGRDALELLGAHGRFVPYGMASGAFTPMSDDEIARRQLTVARFVPSGPDAMRTLTRRALTAAADGWLGPVVGQTFPLEGAADAHAAIEARTTVGKTLLVIDPST
ncbi:MAG TPA: zinc-binding dehydrogenase [Acidimicrobiia bacterium]|jgi:NADPH2:quinone reductase